ncbi:MAG: hypothetical protein WBB74_04805 [Gaiellaceae bacterium]
MPGRLGPRFTLEAAFLIALAVGAALAELSAQWIVLVMGAGWVLVGLFEFTADRLSSRFPPFHRYAPAPPPEPEPEPATIVVPAAERSGEPLPEPGSRRRFFRRRRVEARNEEEDGATQPPRHVHILMPGDHEDRR